MSSIPLADGSSFGSVRYAKKVWEEYGLRPYDEKPKSPKKAKSAKGGKGKGGKGKKGKGGKGHQKKRAYSAREEEYSSDERPQFDSEDEKWYAEEAEDDEDQWWSEGHDSHRHRAKKVKETSALDELFY